MKKKYVLVILVFIILGGYYLLSSLQIALKDGDLLVYSPINLMTDDISQI